MKPKRIQSQQMDRIQMEWLLGQARGRCLHVGCGEKYIAGMVNIDPNPSRPKVDHRYDVHELPFGDGTFDSAISCHVIPSLKAPIRAMREMARVLKPGGIMAHVIPDNRYAPERHDKRFQWQFQHNNWYSPQQFHEDVLTQIQDLVTVELCDHFDEFLFSFRVLCKRVSDA